MIATDAPNAVPEQEEDGEEQAETQEEESSKKSMNDKFVHFLLKEFLFVFQRRRRKQMIERVIKNTVFRVVSISIE